ncbi:NF-X1-type zinc finger protein NFXL1 [Ixodes scapularis]
MEQPRSVGRGRGGRGHRGEPDSQRIRNPWGAAPRRSQPTTTATAVAVPRQHAVQNGSTQRPPPQQTAPGNRKFEEACARIQENLEKFLPQGQEGEERSSSEDELETESILSRVVGSYAEANQGAGDLQRTVQFLTDNLVSGATVCLICIESIKRTEQVWSCDGCYGVLHLTCIQKWAKDSMHQQQNQEQANQLNQAHPRWHCPKCRKEYRSREGLSQYRCFCGQKVDPAYDPWLVPHSCGQTCSRELRPACGHRCLLLCHPGPCPPCPKMVRSSCHCGRAQPTARRCSTRLWSCEGPCGKTLACGRHPCPKTCHPGECDPCPKKSRRSCRCGANAMDRPCATPDWQCDKVCGKRLLCGQHTCKSVCHGGPCGACPRSGPRTCPCGKSKWERPCTEDVGPCGDTCDKLLACGLHHCSQRCHAGDCASCLQVVPKRCRCGAREKAVPCSRDYTCETKCKQLRDCRRHPCSRKCCDGRCPPCEQPCGRMLACKNHRCPSTCHTGPCYPCREKVELSCRCNETRTTVPCGRERSAKPPVCRKPCRECLGLCGPCRVPPECHHEKLDAHACHSGRCPPCTQTCDRTLACGHVCKARCHSAVLTKIMPKQGPRAGPWEPIVAPRLEVVAQPCPPCKEPLPLACRGRHSVDTFACSDLRPYSCGLACGRALPCGNHTCTVECHVVEDAPNEVQAGRNCSVCDEGCKKRRPAGCVHPCTRPCHPGDCAPCTQYIKMKCHCGLNPVFVSCHQWSCEEQRDMLQSCKNRCCKQLDCSHRCPLDCHPGPCTSRSECRKKVTLRCPCKTRKLEGPCNTVGEPPKCDDQCAARKASMEQQPQTEGPPKQEPDEHGDTRALSRSHVAIALALVVALAAVGITYWAAM